MRDHQAFWRDTLISALRNIVAGERMLKQKAIQKNWPQFSIVIEGITGTRRRAGSIIHLLGGMDAPW